MTRDFTQPARERQEWRWDHASRHSRLTQRGGPRKRDGVNEGHETSWMLQVRIGEVFAYRCVLSFQKGEEGPQRQFRDDPREHRPGVGGEREVQAVSASFRGQDCCTPAESHSLSQSPRESPYGWGPTWSPCTAMWVTLPPW